MIVVSYGIHADVAFGLVWVIGVERHWSWGDRGLNLC